MTIPIFHATANLMEIVITETGPGRGIPGVVDGLSPRGVEGGAEIEWRMGFRW